MNWTAALIVFGILFALGVALLAFWVLNAIGFGPDNDPSDGDDLPSRGRTKLAA